MREVTKATVSIVPSKRVHLPLLSIIALLTPFLNTLYDYAPHDRTFGKCAEELRCQRTHRDREGHVVKYVNKQDYGEPRS